jgi:amidase
LLCPVTLVPAFEHMQQGLWSDRVIEVNGRPRSYIEMEGWPALIGGVYLPSTSATVGRMAQGRTPAGLPVGVQVVAPFLHDRTAIQVAGWLGELAGGFLAPPAVG